MFATRCLEARRAIGVGAAAFTQQVPAAAYAGLHGTADSAGGNMLLIRIALQRLDRGIVAPIFNRRCPTVQPHRFLVDRLEICKLIHAVIGNFSPDNALTQNPSKAKKLIC